MGGMKLLRPGALVAAGAAAAYLLDPDRGRARRAKLRDQTLSKARHTTEGAERQARYVEGRLQGAAAKAAGGGTFTPQGDTHVREHLRQVLAELDVDTTDVNVDVVDGVATLRGQGQRPDLIKRIQVEVSKVPGVARVESFLHLPSTPAPNKAEAINAS